MHLVGGGCLIIVTERLTTEVWDPNLLLFLPLLDQETFKIVINIFHTPVRFDRDHAVNLVLLLPLRKDQTK